MNNPTREELMALPRSAKLAFRRPTKVNLIVIRIMPKQLGKRLRTQDGKTLQLQRHRIKRRTRDLTGRRVVSEHRVGNGREAAAVNVTLREEQLLNAHRGLLGHRAVRHQKARRDDKSLSGAHIDLTNGDAPVLNIV